MTTQTKQDAIYLELMLSPMRRCATYMPAFGKGADEKVTLTQFKTMYGADPLYLDPASRTHGTQYTVDRARHLGLTPRVETWGATARVSPGAPCAG